MKINDINGTWKIKKNSGNRIIAYVLRESIKQKETTKKEVNYRFISCF